jgi:hypothetical protein
VHNVLGKNPADGQAAPLTVGIDLAPPSSGTTVTENTVANAATGIRVAPDASGIATTGNHFLANRFENLTAMPVDLRGDGILNPNDPGDTDTGPNQMINYPTITKATQSRITGSAGPVCAGCAIQLYVANHEPGSPNDFAETPVAGGTALTDGAGDFAIDGPAAIPGQWITALVTDQAGNSSEFGPAVRVGVGVVQCGNVGVQAGWNHAGFFGPQPITLGASFPDDGSPVSKILAIYHLDEATGTYSHWIAGTNAGRTLDTLQAGEAYWFLAAQPFILTGGFALNVPLPVQLKSGWNDFVYIGASADVRDALYSVTGKYDELYRWVNEGAGERWTTFGSATTPDWAREFTTMQACTVYQVHMNADATLTPLQP